MAKNKSLITIINSYFKNDAESCISMGVRVFSFSNFFLGIKLNYLTHLLFTWILIRVIKF